jgi:hypothetical protein
MKILILGIIFSTLFAFLLNTAWALESKGPYLDEQLRQPAYKKTFNALFKGQHNIEPWLQGYLKNRNGLETPGRTRTIGSKKYELYSLCQPQYCPGSALHVFFEPGGLRAWALFNKEDGTLRFFGNPDAEMQTALKSASTTDRLALFGLEENEVRAFLDSIQEAVSRNDVTALSVLIQYPIKVTKNGEIVMIENQTKFISAYNEIITSKVKKAILNQKYEELFFDWKGVMIGNGEIWFKSSCPVSSSCESHNFFITAINS